MLKRFMGWLLHQLQKFLRFISGHHASSHHTIASQRDRENQTVESAQRFSSAPPDESNRSDISFTIQQADNSSAQVAIDTREEVTSLSTASKGDVSDDMRMRLDAASSTIPGGDSKLSDMDELAEGARSPVPDSQLVDQLPSIHDLLPAVEQEIEDNAAQQEDNSANSDFSVKEGSFSAQPSQLVLPELDDPVLEPANLETPKAESLKPESTKSEAALSEQALLFSFDITESTDEDSSKTESRTKRSLAADNDTSQPIDDIKTDEVESKVANTVSKNSEAVVLDKASLPYPWSIATPKSQSDTDERERASQSEASVKIDSPAEPVSNAKPEVVQSSEDSTSNSAALESSQSTKHGVVKLLFTMKEGNFHGYIEPKDGTSDILFHQKYINEDIFASLERGVEVVVSIKHIEGKAYATQVELAD